MGPRNVITVHYMGAQAKKKNCYTVMIGDHNIYATVTSDPDVVTDWVEGVDSNRVARSVGFEIEFDFKTQRIATVQLSLVNRCLIFQLPYTSNPSFPTALLDFLGDANIILISSHVGSKIGLLRTRFPFQPLLQGKDFAVNNAFLMDRKKTELTALGFVESDWDRLPVRLSVRQAHYACLDAYLNLRMWQPVPPTAFTTAMLPFMKTSITPHEGIPGDDKDFYDFILYGQTIWITVTAHLTAVREWIEALYIEEVGFELEFDFSIGRFGTMVFFAGNRCLVFRLLDRKDCPPFLEEFLTTHSFAGGNNMQGCVEVLRRQFKFEGRVVRVDVDDRAEFWKKKIILQSIGLGNGVNQWARPEARLTDKEVHYACISAFLNLYFTMNY